MEVWDELCPGQGAVPPCLVLRDARGRAEVTAGGGQGGGDVCPGGSDSVRDCEYSSFFTV